MDYQFIKHGDMSKEKERYRIVYAFLTTTSLFFPHVVVNDPNSKDPYRHLIERAGCVPSWRDFYSLCKKCNLGVIGLAAVDAARIRRVSIAAFPDWIADDAGAKRADAVALNFMDNISASEIEHILESIYTRYEELRNDE